MRVLTRLSLAVVLGITLFVGMLVFDVIADTIDCKANFQVAGNKVFYSYQVCSGR